MVKANKIIRLSLIISVFLLVQYTFLYHQVEHLEESDHSGSCLVCLADSSSVPFLSQNITHAPFFEKEVLFQKFFGVVTKYLYYQCAPRSPPNTII